MSHTFLDVPDTGNFDLLLKDSSELSELKTYLSSSNTITQNQSDNVLKIKPVQLFCIKTKDLKSGNEKVFINFCSSPEIPTPKDITEDELLVILESNSPSSYKIPMSIGEPHDELDKSGSRCKAYDIIINNGFYSHIETSELFKTFLITLSIEATETKYGCEIEKDWVTLKNKRYHGTMPDHFIKGKQKQLVEDITRDSSIEKENVNKLAPEPMYEIRKYPSGQSPEKLIANFKLPNVSQASNIKLDLGEDRITLDTTDGRFYLDIFIPYDIESEKSEASYNTNSQVINFKIILVFFIIVL
ncbi:PIH1 domain-containing protein 1 [Nymphon striatum]|nr:PIH1 domain-containing protein 1 [Nymphon striatum]